MILPYRGQWPKIHETVFIAPSADIIGNVQIGNHTSVWFQAVIRGDVHSICIGENTNIQDHATLHVTRNTHPLEIGNEVTVAHHAVLHGCTIRNKVLIGMNAIVLDGAIIEEECLIGAHTLITQKMKIPARSLVLGSPAVVVRSLTEEEIASIRENAQEYVNRGIEYYGVVPGSMRMGQSNSDLEILAPYFIKPFGDENR